MIILGDRDLREVVKKVPNGTKILIFEGDYGYDWRAHPKGIMDFIDHKFFLNGRNIEVGDYLSTDPVEWSVHPEGVVILHSGEYCFYDEFFLHYGNRKSKMITEKSRSYHKDGWAWNKNGMIFRETYSGLYDILMDRFFINDKLIFNNMMCNDWRSHPIGGVMMKSGRCVPENIFTLFSRRKDSGKVFYYGEEGDDWDIHPKGIVFPEGKDFLVNGKKVIYSITDDSVCNPKDWPIPWWKGHYYGIVIRHSNKFILIVDK